MNKPEVSGINHVIFDLNGVILATNNVKAYVPILPYFPLYFIRKLYEMKWTGIEDDYLNFLGEIEAESTLESFHNGQKLPQIIVDWQTGTDISERVEQQIQDSTTLPYAYKKFILAVVSSTLDPAQLINSRTEIPQGIELLKAFKKNGYKVYVLSNWDAQSFPLLTEKYSELFNLFDGILTSGEAQTLKPHKEMFMQFLDKFNLDARDCIFIDDEQYNVTAAQEKAGIASVLFDKKNIETAIERLQELNIVNATEKTDS